MNAADRLIQNIIKQKNPCVVGLDPEWSKLPSCYQNGKTKTESILQWAKDIIDTIADIVPAVKPQMAFYEVYGAEGFRVFEEISAYAHEKGLLVIDDSKRNDIGNTARAYALAHLAKEGSINADFLTVSPFLGTDSLTPFAKIAKENGKGIFILVKTSNPSSAEISEAKRKDGKSVRDFLAESVAKMGKDDIGEYGYSSVGAVVGATFPEEAKSLRKQMREAIFLVPGFGAQGGSAGDIVSCFNEDGLGAVVNSSRGILYAYQNAISFDGSRGSYLQTVRDATVLMRDAVYAALKASYPKMKY